MKTINFNYKYNILPDNLKSEVNDYIDFLVYKLNNKFYNDKKSNEQDNNILSLSGIFSEKEAEEFKKIIEEDCRKIDTEW